MQHLRLRQLQNDRGETLIEVLASVLVVSLSVLMLLGCVVTSSDVDKKAEKLDKAHYNALSQADTQAIPTATVSPFPTPAPTANVTITRDEIAVTVTPRIEIYGDAGMFSYKRAG